MRKIVEEKLPPVHSTLGILLDRLRKKADIILGGLYGSAKSLLASVAFTSQPDSLIAVLPSE
ncbi:MAG TPA: hypothetical protein PK653_09310, partial [Syntrophales bacterium]|nr:hypothetical protein [Syntrophales bacterium]